MKTIFIDMPPHPAAVAAFPKGCSAGTLLRLIELDEFCLFDRLGIQLLEYFLVIACRHPTVTPNRCVTKAIASSFPI